jgi:hypothetical protein
MGRMVTDAARCRKGTFVRPHLRDVRHEFAPYPL